MPQTIFKSLTHLFAYRKIRGIVLALLFLNLQACSGFGDDPIDQGGYLNRFYGGISVDEPNAALVGEAILKRGGNAADAAVAMAFMLAVTKPSTVSLGAGGVCLVHDPFKDLSESLQFNIPPRIDPAGKTVAPPLMPRAMALLNARYGALQWPLLLSPAERTARLGHKLSRAHAKALPLLSNFTEFSPDAKTILTNQNGELLKEGDLFEQPRLAELLSLIRTRGAGVLSEGATAQKLMDGLAALNLKADPQLWNQYTPEWVPVLTTEVGRYEWLGTRPPVNGGIIQAQLINFLNWDGGYDNIPPQSRYAYMQNLVATATNAAQPWLSKPPTAYLEHSRLARDLSVRAKLENISKKGEQAPAKAIPLYGASAFIAVDRSGLAVACELTLGAPYGGGVMPPKTGMFMAKLPTTKAQLHQHSLGGPAFVIHEDTRKFHYAIAGTNSVGAAAHWLNAETWFSGELPSPPLFMQQFNDQDFPMIGGKPVVAHCPNGLPDPEGEERICTLALPPQANGLTFYYSGL